MFNKAKALSSLKNFSFENVTLHEVDVYIDGENAFGTRNVEALKTTDPDGKVSYVFTIKVPD